MIDARIAHEIPCSKEKRTGWMPKREYSSERASRPLVGFGVLIDNTIKGLTCLHEIMSKYLICGMI